MTDREEHNKLVRDNNSPVPAKITSNSNKDEIEQLKEQNTTLSNGLTKYMVMVLKLGNVMNQNGLAVEVNEIVGACL